VGRYLGTVLPFSQAMPNVNNLNGLFMGILNFIKADSLFLPTFPNLAHHSVPSDVPPVSDSARIFV